MINYLKTHKLQTIAGVILIPIIIFILWFIWAIYTQEPPQFFPFDDSQATYTITKRDNVFYVTYDSLSSINKQFVCEWEPVYKCHTEINNNIEVMVGKTNYNLNQYLNKKIYITKGDFKDGFSKQCIANKCVDIGGPYTGLVIEKMAEITEMKPRDKIIEYQVVEGDTLSLIAEKFNISTNTIKWANNLNNDKVKPGQIIKIPPVSGILHMVEKGETIYSIAKKYRTDAQKIIDFPYNTFSDDKYTLVVGQMIIVPDGIEP